MSDEVKRKEKDNHMRILLVVPPLPERTYPGKTMGPDYLAKALKDYRYNTEILDLDVIEKEKREGELTTRLKEYKPDIVGITNMSIQNDLANEIARYVKDFDKKILVVKGGFHELFGYEYTLNYHHEYVDYVVVGEGERAIVELVKAYENNDLQNQRKYILGLAYYDYEVNKPRFTGRPRLLEQNELDELIPLRLNYSESYNFDIFEKKKTAQVLTVRGCVNCCNFCMESETGPRERKRSIESIYKELYILEEEGYEAVYFDDSTFTRDKQRVKDICNLFKNYFPNMVWGCNTRDDCLDEELINIMEDSGCVYVFTGFESAVPEILKAMNKTHNPNFYLSNAKKIYRRLQKSSIKSSVFLIFGAPKKITDHLYELESFEDVKYTLNFVMQELKPRYLSMNVLRLLPGAPFSKNEKYHCLWPTTEEVHAGYYDKKWYQVNKKKDIRTTHHIYRAFEGRGSIVPPQMDPEYCYKILKYTIDIVNEFNKHHEYQCEIVMDKVFEEAYISKKNGKYKIEQFNKIKTGGPL